MPSRWLLDETLCCCLRACFLVRILWEEDGKVHLFRESRLSIYLGSAFENAHSLAEEISKPKVLEH